MDWGLGNPNKTAALIAMLMVTVWAIAYIRRWGFWVALALFTGLGIALIHTFSRGGIIALFAGLVPVIWYAPRPWARNRTIGVIVSVWIMIGFSIYLGAPQRYEQGVIQEDRSISNRLEIWEMAPQMMVAAPSGWGIGNSGKAYMEWYQPFDQSEEYRTLVNSHLTWLVELGWTGRFIYLAAWFVVILLCWPSSRYRLASICLGIWIAFAIAAVFSSVAESPWLWIIPLAGLAVMLIIRLQIKAWPESRLWLAPPLLSCIVLLLFLLLGNNGPAIRVIDGRVVLGKGEPKTWIIVDNKVMGKSYGHTLRRYLATTKQAGDKSIGVLEPGTLIPSLENKTVVIAGGELTQTPPLVTTAKMIILLNPAFPPQNIGITKDKKSRVTVAFGEFSQSVAVNAWNDYGALKHIEGVGDFIPNWPKFSLSDQ